MQNNYLLLVPMIFPIIMALLTLSIKSKFADRAFREKYVGVTLLINLILVVMVLMQGGRLTLFEITELLFLQAPEHFRFLLYLIMILQ